MFSKNQTEKNRAFIELFKIKKKVETRSTHVHLYGFA